MFLKSTKSTFLNHDLSCWNVLLVKVEIHKQISTLSLIFANSKLLTVNLFFFFHSGCIKWFPERIKLYKYTKIQYFLYWFIIIALKECQKSCAMGCPRSLLHTLLHCVLYFELKWFCCGNVVYSRHAKYTDRYPCEFTAAKKRKHTASIVSELRLERMNFRALWRSEI